jgi:DNA-binding FrmR family transcriptional regulator
MVMEISDDVIADIRRRLHRVSGQLAGVERMLDEGRECKDVVTQISAATRALEQAGFKLVAAGLAYCIAHPDEAAASGYPLDAVEKMFLKLG